jgi:hypothetical protein
MDSLRELSVRPLHTFDEAYHAARAETIRKLDQEISRISFAYDEALRNVRRATTADERVAAMNVLTEVATACNCDLLVAGF